MNKKFNGNFLMDKLWANKFIESERLGHVVIFSIKKQRKRSLL